MGLDLEQFTYLDFLGHGTAVMAAIQEKAPDAAYYAVKVFNQTLQTNVDFLVRAIEWALEQKVDLINLSLGTRNPAHAGKFQPLVDRAAEQGTLLVAAAEAGEEPALPGSLRGVLAAHLDWDCPRESYRVDGGRLYASGYPRPLPGVPVRRNLYGISFAVANLTGFAARAWEALGNREAVVEALERGCA